MSDQGHNQPEPEYPTFPGEGSAEGAPPSQPGPAPAQPSSISNAVKLMWVGAALSLLSVIVSLFTLGSLRETIEESVREADPNAPQSTIDAAYAVGVGFAVVVGLISVGLWLWMAWKNGQGRSWARIVATVLGALNVVFTLIGFTQPGMTAVTMILGVVSMILAVVILVLLWKKESSDYYTAVSQRQVLR